MSWRWKDEARRDGPGIREGADVTGVDARVVGFSCAWSVADEKAFATLKLSILPSRLLIRSRISTKVLSFLQSSQSCPVSEASMPQKQRDTGRVIGYKGRRGEGGKLCWLGLAIVALELELLTRSTLGALLVASLLPAAACITSL